MNYYYTFIKEDQYITVSGSGDDPNNVSDLKWTSSTGAAGVLKQVDDIKSVYSPTIGFVSIDDYKNDIYVQIAKFGSIYKDGWRFGDTNIPAIEPESNIVKSEVLEKAKTKKRVYVKAAKGRKAYSRMQEVGREEIDPKAINNLWEISLDQFKRLCTGDKILLKEHYIKHYMREYTVDNPHPQLEYLVGLMNDRMKDRHSPPIFEEFTEELSMHEKAVAQALGAHEYVPLRVLKDYPDLAKAYGFDISEGLLEAEARQMDFSVIHRLHEMPKSDYDDIMEGVKVDYNRDPKKITDKMLDYVYPEQLKDVKRAAKFRKKIFNALPKHMKYGFTPDTMNEQLHKDMVEFAKKYNLEISDEVKAGYPTIFTDMPFVYTPTGDAECDAAVNDILTIIRNKVGIDDDWYNFVKIKKAVKDIIDATGEQVPIICRGDTMESQSLSMSMDSVSKLIGPDLMDRLKTYDGEPISIRRDEDINRAYGGQEIVLPKSHGTSGNLEVISHEYGHSIEHMLPEISELSHAFLNNRTEDEPIRSLNEVIPGMGYNDSEETKPDGFMSAYIGKIYAAGPTEILSMGMGYLTSPTDMWRMYEEDPEYFGFILAIVSGKAKGIKPGSAHPWTKSEITGDGGIMFEPIDVKLSPGQVIAVATKLLGKGLLKKFEIPDEILEAAGIDPKKMSPDQLKAMFAQLTEKGLLKPKDGAKPTDKKPAEKQPEGAQGTGRPGLVKKKVTVHRGGKTFEQERWVKAGEEEPVEKPKKVEEKPPEKPKGPAIMGLNKPEDEVEEPEGEDDEGLEDISTSMTKDNVEKISLLSDMGVKGGIHKDVTSVIKFKDGKNGIYKTISDIGIFGEVRTYGISKILGFNVVPETVKADFGKGQGSCQGWVENSEGPYDDFSMKGCKINENHFDDLSKIFVMDLINGNGDRHAGNVMIDKDNHCWAIDNEDWGSDIGERTLHSLDDKIIPSNDLYAPMMKWMGKIIAPAPGVFEKQPEDGGKANRLKAFSEFKDKVINNMKVAVDNKDEIINYEVFDDSPDSKEKFSNIKKNIEYIEKYLEENK